MAFEFSAEPMLRQSLAAVTASDPANPFHTLAYAEAMRTLGYEPWLLSLREGARDASSCVAFIKAGRFSRSLEITSLPAHAREEARDEFWRGLRDFCRRSRVSHVEAGSFASTAVSLPVLPGELSRRARREYVLDLGLENPWAGMSSNHLRNVKAAAKASIEMRRADGSEGCAQHFQLVGASFARRTRRGEDVHAGDLAERIAALVRAGAGELFQATRGGETLSSILVLLAERGAYYQSAGTSPEGMACGASHFLVREIARNLRERGVRIFNLGGADEASAGLRRFKSGFGARAIELEAAEFFWGSRMRKKLRTAARLLRDDPSRLVREALGRLERYVVYAATASDIAPPELVDGLALRKLSDDELSSLGAQSEELRDHATRFRRVGFNAAYGLFVGEELAHVAWLVTAEHDRRQPVRNVKLKEAEAEITHCVTLSKFRGRGLYPFAIRGLAQVARGRGVRRLYMITSVENVASQRGIEKADFARKARVMRLVFTHLPWEPCLTYRGHRWGFGMGQLK